jgi:hypothetical protein
MMDTANSQEEFPSSTQGLIVDFPCEPRVPLKSEGIVSTAPKFARLQVRFSQYSEEVTIPYDDAKSKWYTKEEQSLFRQSRLTDAHRLRNIFRDSTLTSEEVLYECVGIENIIFSHVLRHAIQKKKAHSSVVLMTQRMHQGDPRIEELSEASKKSSQWARERGAQVATLYARNSCN